MKVECNKCGNKIDINKTITDIKKNKNGTMFVKYICVECE